MKILLIAPHPFYKERGTPIAVKLLLDVLCENGYKVDLLTYHEGDDIVVNNLTVYRIPKPFLIKNVRIGFSWKKIVCDVFIFFSMLKLVIRNKYDVIHAVEESIFLAVLLNKFLRLKLVYDMDSSIADQIVEKWGFLSAINWLLEGFEKWAVKNSDLVLPVCQYLADKVTSFSNNKRICVLQDIPLIDENKNGCDENLRETTQTNGLIALYVGNLEHYQGIDLMINGVSLIELQTDFKLIIIGGKEEDIDRYSELSRKLGVADNVAFLGPRPLSHLNHYLTQADILISPRLKGKNTPMKIYSYLASGVPVLATNIESHTQLIDQQSSLLVAPDPNSFAEGLSRLLSVQKLRQNLGTAGKKLIEENYSLVQYKKKLTESYHWLTSGLV